MQQEKIFLGHTPADQRKFILKYLQDHKGQYPKVCIPCVGTFSLVKTALDAGYKPSDIECSDISLFSTLLGYYFMDRPISEIEFTLSDDLQPDYEALEDDVSRIAYIFYHMKILQYKEIFYEEMKREAVEMMGQDAIDQFKKKLIEMKTRYAGIKYKVEDLRNELIERKDTITIVNPPVITKGYAKMFDFKDKIVYNPPFEEFVWSKEYHALYNSTRSFDCPYIWYRYKDLKDIPTDVVIFAKEYPKRFDYWIINDPKFYTAKKVLKSMKPKNLHPIKGMEMFTEGDVRPEAEIKIFQITEEEALYYRELYAHKLGTTKAEVYVGLTIDGKLFGTAGFMMSEAVRLMSNDVHESYAFSTINLKYPALGRLLMMCLTSNDCRKFLYSRYTKNRIYKLENFRTVCLSKYRKVKKNNNLLEVERREKLGAFYKLHYVTPFYDRTFSDCVKIWLQEIQDGKKY